MAFSSASSVRISGERQSGRVAIDKMRTSGSEIASVRSGADDRLVHRYWYMPENRRYSCVRCIWGGQGLFHRQADRQQKEKKKRQNRRIRLRYRRYNRVCRRFRPGSDRNSLRLKKSCTVFHRNSVSDSSPVHSSAVLPALRSSFFVSKPAGYFLRAIAIMSPCIHKIKSEL